MSCYLGWVAGPAFIWFLGGLTVLTGLVLITMLFRRWSARPTRGSAAKLATGERRLIDEYAIETKLAPDSREDALPTEGAARSKICPACGSRYGHQYRTCAQDDSELAMIN